MSTWISSSGQFWMDNASGTLTNISTYVNNVDSGGGTQLLDDTGLSDTIENWVGGLAAGTNITVNGFLNSTTYTMIAPLQNKTSVTKTIQILYFTGKYRYGEAWPSNVKLTQTAKQQGVWSIEFMAENGLTATSIAQA